MAQVRIYGLKERLATRRESLSNAIHASLVEVLGLPPEKRFQRFIDLDREDFVFPPDRSEDYTVVEISMFEGRSAEAKRNLIRELFARVGAQAGIAGQDLEITIIETPRANWGIRGRVGDELGLPYKIEI